MATCSWEKKKKKLNALQAICVNELVSESDRCLLLPTVWRFCGAFTESRFIPLCFEGILVTIRLIKASYCCLLPRYPLFGLAVSRKVVPCIITSETLG